MFKRILIANRGEIAQRIIRTCREMGIETVAVYSQADADASYLRQADETICIGPAQGARSYLNIPSIISAAEIADVEAIHPGYGFLSENAHFAEVCNSCNITFIGPSPESIEAVGNKANARALAKKAGVPIVPGSDGPVGDEDLALRTAKKLGYPVMIKAAAGGGGRGMRIARNDPSLVSGFHAARTEAEAAFGDGTVYLEKFIENPRHVEFQILGDQHGELIHLFERDCSIQRRHQKLIEESPSPLMTPKLRQEMGKAAVRVAKAAGYHNAGTVEFLVDKDRNFYFIEVNARIQVEHSVTELVTGIDLIEQQIRIAAGEPLMFRQDSLKQTGHAIEVRINAEDPDRDFQPSPGRIDVFVPPGGPGIRLDSHAYSGYRIPPNYDSMIGKLMAHRPTRDHAIRCLSRALDEFVIEGPKTTIPILRKILNHPDFRAGDHDTGFVGRYFGGGHSPKPTAKEAQ
ncbi:MAG TPA: acetyl-CoA carboxylase biotin carboxylase subunit [Planctomycetota bacterium]|nr:acetyl-CoA carboxylase biotin carboxylase subunit [Planctomycetota bacterium]